MPTYQYTSPENRYTIGQPWTPGVRLLILLNVGIFLLQLTFARSPLLSLVALQVPEIFENGRWWQPLTYFFLHSGFWHLAFNMFALWMFGCEVEQKMGRKWFLIYYLTAGIGAGLCVAGVGKLAGEHSLTIGASGAVFGILMAYGILFAERSITLLLFFILPVRMKAKTMVLLFGAFEFLAGVGQAFGHVSHLAHLSGLLIGYLFFRWRWPGAIPPFRAWESVKMWWFSRRVRKIDPEEYLDEILEKISRQGRGSLNQQEREILDEASRRRRDHWRGPN